jgi:hypothetical protein
VDNGSYKWQVKIGKNVSQKRKNYLGNWRASVRKTIDGVSRTYNGNHHADEEAAARQADE